MALQPDLALVEAPARAGTPLAAVPAPAAAVVGRTGPYQGAWNKYKTGIPEKDTKILYNCMAEIGGEIQTCSNSTRVPSRQDIRNSVHIVLRVHYGSASRQLALSEGPAGFWHHLTPSAAVEFQVPKWSSTREGFRDETSCWA